MLEVIRDMDGALSHAAPVPAVEAAPQIPAGRKLDVLRRLLACAKGEAEIASWKAQQGRSCIARSLG